MNRDQPTRLRTGAGGASTTPRGDVRATAQGFLRCPHCERVLFNPDWNERL